MSQSIAVLGSNVVPLAYKVPVPGTLTALAASGTFDGSGAASFQPCLSFYDSDGNLIARAAGPTVAAGASAEVSWFPRVGGGSLANVQTFVGARVYSVALQTFPNTTNSDFSYDTVDVDVTGMANLGANPKVLTARLGGFYLISAQVNWAVNSTGRRLLQVFKNGYYSLGTGHLIGSSDWNAIAGGVTPTFTSVIEFLNPGDFVSVGVYQNSGGSLSSTTGVLGQPYANYLAAALIGVSP